MAERCVRCRYVRRCLNGAFCTRLHIYVEHRADTPCDGKPRFAASVRLSDKHPNNHPPREEKRVRDEKTNK